MVHSGRSSRLLFWGLHFDRVAGAGSATTPVMSPEWYYGGGKGAGYCIASGLTGQGIGRNAICM